MRHEELYTKNFKILLSSIEDIYKWRVYVYRFDGSILMSILSKLSLRFNTFPIIIPLN